MMDKKFQSVLILVLAIIVVVGNLGYKRWVDHDSSITESELTECRIDQVPCKILFDNGRYLVSSEGEIKPLKKFVIKIVSSTTELMRAQAIFRMRDMDMGKHIYSFNKTVTGAWFAEVIIPVCTTGRRDWEIELQLETKFKIKKFVMLITV